MLANKGKKAVKYTTAKAYPILFEKELKVIFYLLMNKQNGGRPYREIMYATGVAIGTVKNVIDGPDFTYKHKDNGISLANKTPLIRSMLIPIQAAPGFLSWSLA